jgi:ATP-dependent DNA ligase
MIERPIAPMLAKLAEGFPDGEGWAFEPKWDGFRALVFREGGGEPYLQSRDLKPLNRYFPELIAPLADQLPPDCVLDGEIVIAGPHGLDFDSLLLRIHPAKSRVALLASQTPSSFVAFDLLFLQDRDLMNSPQSERRALLSQLLSNARPPLYLTPSTLDRAVAQEWFSRFEGAGLDGVIAKRLADPYVPDKRTMVKIKHARTADCVVAGFRWHKNGPGTMVGSLLLGLYNAEGILQHVGVTASFTAQRRRELAQELEPLRVRAAEEHPWREWANFSGEAQRVPGMGSRWNRGKDLSWEPLRIERVCEVAYDHLQGDRFRHATQFLRWRLDKQPRDCGYAQLEVTPPAELRRLFEHRP